jgi:hypothetical protein
MKTEIEKAIEILAKLVTEKSSHDEALKYTQSILNLTHALASLHHLK